MAHPHDILDPLAAGLFFLHLELDDLADYLDALQEAKEVTQDDLTDALERYAWLVTLRALVEGQATRGVA